MGDLTNLTPDRSPHLYNKTLSSTLDKHAPLIIKAISNKKQIPWFNSNITKDIRSRQSLEKAWRKDKLNADKYPEFYHQWRRVVTYFNQLKGSTTVSSTLTVAVLKRSSASVILY